MIPEPEEWATSFSETRRLRRRWPEEARLTARGTGWGRRGYLFLREIVATSEVLLIVPLVLPICGDVRLELQASLDLMTRPPTGRVVSVPRATRNFVVDVFVRNVAVSL